MPRPVAPPVQPSGDVVRSPGCLLLAPRSLQPDPGRGSECSVCLLLFCALKVPKALCARWLQR